MLFAEALDSNSVAILGGGIIAVMVLRAVFDFLMKNKKSNCGSSQVEKCFEWQSKTTNDIHEIAINVARIDQKLDDAIASRVHSDG